MATTIEVEAKALAAIAMLPMNVVTMRAENKRKVYALVEAVGYIPAMAKRIRALEAELIEARDVLNAARAARIEGEN